MTILEPHLDLDQVSAAVDGDQDPSVVAHLLACLACREQVDAWRRTLGALRELPAVPDADPLVERAMQAWTPPAMASDHKGAAGPSPAGPGPAGPGPAGRTLSLRNMRRRRPSPAVTAAAVLVVLIAAAVVGIGHLGGSGQGGSTSSNAASALAPTAQHAVAARPDVGAGSAAGTSSSTRDPVSGQSSLPTINVAGKVQLAAQLRRVAPTGSTSRVAAPAPCLRQATGLAGRDRDAGFGGPYFDEDVRYAGVAGRVFVFAGAHGPVAVVVGARTCSLLATVLF